MYRFVALFVACLLLGCSGESDSTANRNDEPITVEAWMKLEAHEKYAPETFERLKKNDPALRDEYNWDQFMREFVVPERRKDIPTDY